MVYIKRGGVISKRGQISLFIIAGLVVLLLATLGYYIYQDNSLADRTTPERTYESNKVTQLMESCIFLTSKEAIQRMGVQSGYVYIPDYIETVPPSYIKNDPFGIIKTPLWQFQGKTRQPTLSDMEAGISRYVNENINACLNNFTSLREEYDVEILSEPETKTTAADQNVVVDVDYKIKIKNKADGQQTVVSEYSIYVPVKLKTVYELASAIFEAENNGLFLENLTIDFMAMDTKIPISGMEFKCERMTWHLSDIKDELKTILYYNLPRIRIDNTDYAPFMYPKETYEKFTKYKMRDIAEGRKPDEEPPEDIYEYTHFLWNVAEDEKSDFRDLSAEIIYLNWSMDLAARPSEHDILKSNVGKGPEQYLNFLCVNVYHFTYDVVYPVMIAIRDPSSFNGDGYVFRFAIPVVIDHNQGDRTAYGYTPFEGQTYDTGFCSQVSDKAVDIRAIGLYNNVVNQELPYVNLSIKCIKYACPLGETVPDNQHLRLVTALPSACGGGIIAATKGGYLTAEEQYIGQDPFEISMKKLKTLNFSVVKHKKGTLDSSELLGPNEKAAIYISYVNDEGIEYEIYKSYPYGEDENAKAIDLLDENAVYEIEMMLFRDDNLIGGYNNKLWQVSYQDFEGKKAVVLHVYEELPNPADDEDMLAMMDYLDTNNEYKSALKPTFR